MSYNYKDYDENVIVKNNSKISQEIEAKIKGYEGEACSECGNFTLVRNVDEVLRVVDALQYFEEKGEFCPIK